MAVANTKSSAITNRDATPRVKNNSKVEDGMLRECIGTLESVSGDDINSVYRFCQVPSNCRISQVLLYSDDIGANTVAHFGFFQTTDNGGAVVDADAIASSVSLKDGALNGTDITHESGSASVGDIAAAEQYLWEALGLSADPKRFYDLCAQLTVAADAAATVTVVCRYVV